LKRPASIQSPQVLFFQGQGIDFQKLAKIFFILFFYPDSSRGSCATFATFGALETKAFTIPWLVRALRGKG
jgi:hypothetical protein